MKSLDKRILQTSRNISQSWNNWPDSRVHDPEYTCTEISSQDLWRTLHHYMQCEKLYQLVVPEMYSNPWHMLSSQHTFPLRGRTRIQEVCCPSKNGSISATPSSWKQQSNSTCWNMQCTFHTDSTTWSKPLVRAFYPFSTNLEVVSLQYKAVIYGYESTWTVSPNLKPRKISQRIRAALYRPDVASMSTQVQHELQCNPNQTLDMQPEEQSQLHMQVPKTKQFHLNQLWSWSHLHSTDKHCEYLNEMQNENYLSLHWESDWLLFLFHLHDVQVVLQESAASAQVPLATVQMRSAWTTSSWPVHWPFQSPDNTSRSP